MDVVKALLVFFALTGCAEVASELPLSRSVPEPNSASPHLDTAARLGPPNPRRTSARHVDGANVPHAEIN